MRKQSVQENLGPLVIDRSSTAATPNEGWHTAVGDAIFNAQLVFLWFTVLSFLFPFLYFQLYLTDGAFATHKGAFL